MKRRRLNLSLDHATYTRAESLATRLGFRSTCSFARALLRAAMTPKADRAKGECRGEDGHGGQCVLFEGFDDFERYAEWEREECRPIRGRGRRR